MYSLKTLPGVLILVCLLVPSGCKKIEELTDAIDLTREQFVTEIDKGILTIENSANSAESVLLDIADQFGDFSKGLAYSADRVLDAVVGDAGVEARCLVDFMGNRAIHYLLLMKAEFITGVIPPPPPPLICRASMDVVDLNAPSSERYTLNLYGADFLPMYKDSFSLVLVNPGGNELVLGEDIFVRQSSYKYVLNLFRIDDDLLDQWSYLSIRFNDAEVSAVGIVPKDPPIPPKPREVNRTPGVYTFIPPHVKNGHDKKFGRGLKVRVSFYIRHTRTQAYVQIIMRAIDKRNETVAAGWSQRFYFFQAPYGEYIKGIVDEDAGGHELVEYKYYGNHIVRTINEDGIIPHNTDLGGASITGTIGGEEAGISTGIKFQFTKPFKFLLEKEQ